jgi:hypothetical protein
MRIFAECLARREASGDCGFVLTVVMTVRARVIRIGQERELDFAAVSIHARGPNHSKLVHHQRTPPLIDGTMAISESGKTILLSPPE